MKSTRNWTRNSLKTKAERLRLDAQLCRERRGRSAADDAMQTAGEFLAEAYEEVAAILEGYQAAVEAKTEERQRPGKKNLVEECNAEINADRFPVDAHVAPFKATDACPRCRKCPDGRECEPDELPHGPICGQCLIQQH